MNSIFNLTVKVHPEPMEEKREVAADVINLLFLKFILNEKDLLNSHRNLYDVVACICAIIYKRFILL